ncbi:MAG TPA: hypothetical protein VL371_10645 [Gemmataceae bacterium]|nr:hypothetical protein [Gemmataceae bacterium]
MSGSRWAVLALGVSLILTAPSPAQSTPSARAAEAQIKLSLKDGVRTADVDPAKGAEKLRLLLRQVESDVSLPADRRAQLARVVKDRLRIAETGPDDTAIAATEQKLAERAADADRQTKETARLKSGLELAVALRKEGRTADAQAKLDEVYRDFKDNAVVQAVRRIDTSVTSRQDAAETRALKEQRANDALSNIDRTAVVPGRDVEFPKDFKERTAARRADTAPTAEELKLMRALNTTLNANFKDSKLQDAMDYLATVSGLTIIIDKSALDDVQANYNSPVTFVLKQPVSVRTALRGILGSLGLTYVINREGVVWVTTTPRAREFMVTKTYNIADLAVPVGFPWFPDAQEALNVLSLIDLIVTSVDPESWQNRGGPGTIRYFAPTRSLVIRQSAEIHGMVKSSLYK